MAKEIYTVEVRRTVRVTIERDSFTPEFMEEFRQYIDRTVDEIDQHIERLAALYATGIIDNGDFIEGYGKAREFGLSFETLHEDETEILTPRFVARDRADDASLNSGADNG